MGAKDSVKFKLRRPTFKCDICPKKFLSSQALASHTIVHKGKAKSKIQVRELTTLLGKSIRPLETKKSVEESDLVLEIEPTRIMDFRKIEYECPQCRLCFAVYFSAFRHIQKNHCINSKGLKVPPNSSEIIKPTRIEVCMKCNQRLVSNDPHSCIDMCTSIDPQAAFICTGCKQQFNSLNLFDMHVVGLHSDDVETLFFPDRVEFSFWKEDLESQTKVRYLLLDGKSSSKQVYHCTYHSTADESEEVLHFCPSTIFVKDFTKSIQVHIYKQHFGHDCKYKLPAKYIKYRIKQLLKQPSPITEPFELKGLQMDFKTLLDFLLVESKKCEKATLDVLYKKAQEMLAVVNNCGETPKTNKRNMTDDQISDTLELMDVKRKKTNSPVENTKPPPPEPELAEPDVTKVNSSAVTSNTEVRSKRKVKTKEVETTKPAKFVLSSPCSSKSSFNDSYREFVDKNFKAQTEVVEEVKKSGKALSKSNENQSKQVSPDHKTVSKPNGVKTKKNIVKTKMGQFKPSLSPKVAKNDISVSIKERRSSIGKIDFEYEVREQENDCNILILKI